MALQKLDDQTAGELVSRIDSILDDEFVSGFFWGYSEGLKDKKTLVEVAQNLNFLSSDQATQIVDLLTPYYDKGFDLESSLLNNA